MSRLIVFLLATMLVLVDRPAFAVSVSAVAETSGAAGDNTVNLPACNAPDKYYFFIGFAGGPGTVTLGTVTETEFNGTSVSESNRAQRHFHATATNDATLVMTHNNGFRWAAHVYCVTGQHATTGPENGTIVLSSGAPTSDPPSLDPSWDAATESTLWFIVQVSNGTEATFTSCPTNYTANCLQENNGNGSVTGSLVTSYRVGTAGTGTEDPGVVTFTSNIISSAQTVAVRPAATQSQAPRSMHQYQLRR